VAKDGIDVSDAEDVESSIQRELESMKSSTSSSLFKLVRLEIQCGRLINGLGWLLRIRIDNPDLHKAVSFVRTSDSIDPVSLVHSICKDAQSKPDQKKSRFIKRMTPMTLMRKTMSGGLEHVCKTVLRPHFHAGGPAKKVSEDEWSTKPFRTTQSKAWQLRLSVHRRTLCVLISREQQHLPG
jgi:tRNA acetyltransferase TAN1